MLLLFLLLSTPQLGLLFQTAVVGLGKFPVKNLWFCAAGERSLSGLHRVAANPMHSPEGPLRAPFLSVSKAFSLVSGLSLGCLFSLGLPG